MDKRPASRPLHFFLAGRRFPSIVVFLFLVAFLLWYWISEPSLPQVSVSFTPPKQDVPPPPTWDWLKNWEQNLPQHDLHVSPPDGTTGRYVKFSNQAQQLGWNNILNEILMNAHLAHASGRGYVFPDYTWAGHHYPWSFSDEEKSQREWPPHTPLNALMSGPVAGGSWDVNDTTPRSISTAWFDVVCPHEARRYVHTSDLKQGMGDEPGDRIVTKWADFLRNAPERCIDIVPSSDDGFPQIFDIWLWGNTRLLPLWDSFSSSPVSRLLAASPIVKAAVDRNEYSFLPRTPRPAVKAGASAYDRVLSLHIRRGDYEGACKHFATWSSTFYGWNQLEFLPDRFIPPPGAEWGKNTPENFEIYMRRCLPSLEDVARKIRHARDNYGGDLDVVYILTNEKGEWLDELMDLLMNDGWSSVKTSKDLILESAEQKEVSMAIDMDIARRAGVFIGNGWSSFTSNIVHRRLVDGKSPMSVRFY
ncbi:hypothetical protein BDZ89DRAFT_1165052 [Hymenopellis radicata]|nr:hypothetical protein BDZ89DRAFT_1165052 [Hymenopellis radicata]